VIEIKNVTKTHVKGQTDVHALRGVTYSIERGVFHFILGPSGSGKSSLLYLMGALDEPTSGEILFEDRSLSSLRNSERDAYRRDDVGFIFQSFNLLNNLDAVDNTLVPYLPQGVSTELRNRAVAMLQQVGLGDRLDHRPHQPSPEHCSNNRNSFLLTSQPESLIQRPVQKSSDCCENFVPTERQPSSS
jgi:putative ABC transport system ATP-binding protein